ncbi:MAG: ANTAR domain-containing protein [Rhizobiaceae bacterium]|nr:ANTAR domain-containing protein [Rhizobiaceae bacterium]
MLKALREIRNVKVLVVHPKDRERDELVDHVRRIGCRVETVWPPQNDIPSDADIVFVLFRQDALTSALLRALSERSSTVTLIGIVEFESPGVIEAVVHAGTSAVITKPIRAFGLLTSMIVAHSLSQKDKNYTDRIQKLEAKLSGLKKLEKAKSILMSSKGMTEDEAYAAIRSRSMTKRVALDIVCAAIIEAKELGL